MRWVRRSRNSWMRCSSVRSSRYARAERRGVVAPDVAAGGQGREAVEGGAGAQRLVGAAVHELQQLHRELDVAQPAGAELELAVGLGGRDVLLDPAAHRLHVVDEVLAARGLPHHRLHGVAVRLARRSRSPATGRALSSAWNSQVLAQRS